MSGSYRLLLRAPGAAAFYLAAALGRVGIAMTSLGLVWLVHGQTGSYASAGLVTGSFAVAEGAVGPQAARLVDRFGQVRVLPPLLVVHAAAVTALLVAAGAGSPLELLMALGAAVGASMPQLGALSAARWATLVHGSARPELLTPALSLESLANATAYLLGPVLVSVVGAAGHPALGTATAAGLVVVGGTALASQRRTAPPAQVGPRRQDGSRPRRLIGRMFLLLLGVNVAIGIYFGAVQVSVTAFATEQGSAGAAPVLYAISSLAGLAGGWLFGLRVWRFRPTLQLVAVAAALTVAALLVTVAGTLLGVACALGLAGLAVPPILVLSSVLTEQQVDRTVLTQALTWLSSASAAGSAAAAAIVGVLVDAFGATGGFSLAAAAALTVTLLAAGLDQLRTDA